MLVGKLTIKLSRKYGSIETISIPSETVIFKMACQKLGYLSVWYLENDGDETPFRLNIVGTGVSIDIKQWAYIDTVFDGTFVWHVFGEALN